MMNEPTQRSTRLRNLAVPLTAQEAFAEAWSAAQQYDLEARLVLVTSGEDVDPAGRAELWEFFFDLPRRQAQATCSVGRFPDPEADDDPVTLLVEQVRPFVPPGDLWTLLREGDAAVRRYTTQQWQQQLAGRPALPVPFYDSVRAVDALAAQGVDFTGRGHGRYLGGKVQVSGDAVWYVSVGDAVYTTPFAPRALPAGRSDQLPQPPGGAPPALPPGAGNVV